MITSFQPHDLFFSQLFVNWSLKFHFPTLYVSQFVQDVDVPPDNQSCVCYTSCSKTLLNMWKEEKNYMNYAFFCLLMLANRF